MYFLGCPMWANDRWQGSLYQHGSHSATFLAQYCRFFNAVEGNTTFYADPTPQTIARWAEQSAASLTEHPASRFCFDFKVPKKISHQGAGIEALASWLELLHPLQQQIGFIHLQLPASFSPAQLASLAPLLELIRQQYRCAVEIRHPAFFDKAAAEQALHQLLRQYQCERISLDSRALFSVAADSPALQDAQRKKPRLPVHVKALTQQPVFRFIGLDDLAANRQFYQPWLQKMLQWLALDYQPTAFFHTPDNRLAPQLARQFASDLLAIGGPSHQVLQPWPERIAVEAANQLPLFSS